MSKSESQTADRPSRDAHSGLTAQIFVALLLGVFVGWMFPSVASSLSFLGEIFMAALKMLIMPLILVTMIVGVASLGTPQELGRLGTRAVLYYLVTTALAVVVGLVVVNQMRPGETDIPKKIQKAVTQAIPQKGPVRITPQKRALIRSAFKSYLLQGQIVPSTREQYRAKVLSSLATQSILQVAINPKHKQAPQLQAYHAIRAELIIARVGMKRGIKEAAKLRKQSQKKGPPLTVSRFLHMQIKKILQNPFKAMATGNVLGMIVFSILLGLMLVSLGSKGRPALDVAESLNHAMMKLVELVMLLTPVGVFSLMAHQIARSGLDILVLLGKYMVCVVVALLIHAVIVLPLLLALFGRRSPWKYFGSVRAALGIAFSTSSSSATLPVTMEMVESKGNVRPHVSGFVLPLGATINMDGTALYEAIAALFIAQIYGIDLSLGSQVLIFMTAALAAIGAAGIPSAGTVTMVMVLSAVGLPISGIGLILAVDRLLDMCRTTVNVWGDAIGAAILDRYETDPKGTVQ